MIITVNHFSIQFSIASNLDEDRINTFSIEQEKIKCTQFLGKALYDELVEADQTLDKWKNLLEYVKPVLLYWIYVAYLTRGQIFNTATGAVIKRTDNSIPLSDEERRMAVKQMTETARFYETQLQSFLEENAEIYTTYNTEAKHQLGKTFRVKKIENTSEI